MKVGQPGDRWSLARVVAAMVVGGILLGAVGYVFDLVVGPAIGQGGWWTVFFHGGLIAGATAQAVREFATPTPAEREAVAAEARASAADATPDAPDA